MRALITYFNLIQERLGWLHLSGVSLAIAVIIMLSWPGKQAEAMRSPHITPRTIAPSWEPMEPLYSLPLNLPTLNDEESLPGNYPQWQRQNVQAGDTLSSLFLRAGLSETMAYRLGKQKQFRRLIRRLKPGQHFNFLIHQSQQANLLGLEYHLGNGEFYSVHIDGDRFVVNKQTQKSEARLRYASANINSSLFEAAKEAGISENIAMEVASIFGWDIDFALDIRRGDSFRLLYEEIYINGERQRDGNILIAEFINQGKTFQAIRFTDKQGRGQYYNPKGRSMRKAFLRTPVDFRRISSRFGNRYHPVHKKVKAHRGVDYSARPGTPIKAAGDGKIIFRGRKGGYGKTVIIRHGNTYSTLYAHMRSYARGMHPGRYIRQGQTIGYVGQTGTATGPHLHYEFRVHGVHRNPLTVRLPTASPIKPIYKAEFQELAAQRLGQLDIIHRSYLASAETAIALPAQLQP